MSKYQVDQTWCIRTELKNVIDREPLDDDTPMGWGPETLLYRLLISPTARRGILRQLHRMNISYATLFPGLDGFAQSLGTNLTILWTVIRLRGMPGRS